MAHKTIIAEIGQNHLGDMDLACYLIDQAKLNGADLAKFQLYDSVKLYGEKQDTELSFDQAKMLFDYGAKQGIEVFFSVFDTRRLIWCEDIGVKTYKIAATRKNEYLSLAMISTGKSVIESLCEGYSKIHDVKTLFCVAKYPAGITDYSSYGDLSWGMPHDGISDHTIGLDAAKIALTRGAEIIEKHFAIDHQTGVDAKWSMSPDELKELRRFADVVSLCT